MSQTLNIQALAEDLPFPLFRLSSDDETILWANQAAQAWLGQSSNRLSGKLLWDCFGTDEATKTIIHKCAQSAAPVTIRDCVIKYADEEALFHMTAYPTEEGVALYLYSAGPRQRESRLGGQMASGMGRLVAHEIKNPLAGIKGAAQLLRDDVESDEGQSLLDLISSEIDRIRRLADRMETLGDRDPKHFEAVNIHGLLRKARLNIQSANPDVVFTERYDPSLPDVRGDADTLMQALLNLIKNASEALRVLDGGGEIILQTRFRSGVSHNGGKQSQNLPVEICVIDNGPGIDEALRAQMFQPFVSNKQGGQGLGLTLVSKVASAHGGIVEVTSRPGQTQFSLLLPTPNGDFS